MSTTESQQRRLLDTDPTVVMDISMGKIGKNIEFDYEAFRETNHRLGGKEDASDLTVHLHPHGMSNHYTHSDATIHLESNDVTKKRKTRRNLQHELQHHIDLSEKPATRGQVLRQKIGSKVITNPLLVGAVGPLALPGIFAGLRVGMDHVPVHEVIDKFTIAPSLGSAAIIGAASLYYLDKTERRARKAEKKNLKPIITTSPTP